MRNIETKNYYEILGVSKTASKEEIKAAYKNIALVYHPDSNFFDEIISSAGIADNNESETFKILTAAYNTLINSAERVAYDATLPPDLPGWDSAKPDIIGDKLAGFAPGQGYNRGATSSVYGVFGSKQNFESEEQEESQIHNAMYHTSQQTGQSFFKRILLSLGLGK